MKPTKMRISPKPSHKPKGLFIKKKKKNQIHQQNAYLKQIFNSVKRICIHIIKLNK